VLLFSELDDVRDPVSVGICTDAGESRVMGIVTRYLVLVVVVAILIITVMANLPASIILVDVLLRPNRWFPHG
jgi:hypothetical protein